MHFKVSQNQKSRQKDISSGFFLKAKHFCFWLPDAKLLTSVQWRHMKRHPFINIFWIGILKYSGRFLRSNLDWCSSHKVVLDFSCRPRCAPAVPTIYYATKWSSNNSQSIYYTVWTVNDVLSRSIPLELNRSMPF